MLIGVLSIGEGFRAVLDMSGADDVAIVLRSGATDEMGSGLDAGRRRASSPTRRTSRATATAPIASPELYVIVDVPLKRTGTAANVPLRGVGPQAPKLRQNFRIVEGRNFTPGTFEVIVGRGAAAQFAGLDGRQSPALGHDRLDWSPASSRIAAASPSRRSGPTQRCCRARTTAARPISRCACG